MLRITLLLVSAVVSVTVGQLSVNQLRNKIPLPILKEISKMNSTSEFMKKFVTRDTQEDGRDKTDPENDEDSIIDRNLTTRFTEDVFSGPGSVDDDGANMAATFLTVPSEGCQSKYKEVSLPRDGKSNILYWPDCIMMDQCSGCCTSDLLECRPVNTTAHEVYAAVLEYNWTLSTFLFKGVSKFEMYQHHACECQCKIQQYHCNPTKQKYVEDECRCRCLNENMASSCTSKKKWDDNECQCVCQKFITCPFDEYFHNGTCSCVKREVVLDEESNSCAGKVCRARTKAVWRSGQCQCVPSDDWGDQQNAGSVDIQGGAGASSTTTQRPIRRPRPFRRRAVVNRHPRRGR